jgi:AcrR family transcriptional regulator
MARPLSEEKRDAILAAATQAVAAQGVSAPTSKIAAAAGIAEGTLFSYFKTKDDLLNQLYIEIKRDLAAAILVGYRSQDKLADRWRHLWDHYMDWGVANRAKSRALRQLEVSDRILESTRRFAAQVMRDAGSLLDESLKAGVLREQAADFLTNTIEALAEMTLDFMAREPSRRDHYKRAGFETLWNAISKR